MMRTCEVFCYIAKFAQKLTDHFSQIVRHRLAQTRSLVASITEICPLICLFFSETKIFIRGTYNPTGVSTINYVKKLSCFSSILALSSTLAATKETSMEPSQRWFRNIKAGINHQTRIWQKFDLNDTITHRRSLTRDKRITLWKLLSEEYFIT